MKGYISAGINYTEKPDIKLFKRHTHIDYEIFCFLSGEAKYFVEGNVYKLKPNDILIIKKSEVHALIINKAIPYTRYVINFNAPALLEPQSKELIRIIESKPLGKHNRIPSTEQQTKNWLHYLDKIVTLESLEDKRLYLTVLVNELCRNLGKEGSDDYADEDNEKLIEYINTNLLTISTLDEICEHFYISKTHLNRRFRAMTGATVWEYIVTKRLIAAKDMLMEGYKPNVVSEKCGWMEYSSFYRAYKLHFGVSPKDDYVKK